MNNTVSRVMVTEPAAAGHQAKTNAPDDGKFKDMLAEASQASTVAENAGTNTAGTKTENAEPQEQEQQIEQGEQEIQDVQDAQDAQDVQEYAQQAAAAMQTQVMAPVITMVPKMEIPEETDIAGEEAAAEEAFELPAVQAQSANSGVQSETQEQNRQAQSQDTSKQEMQQGKNEDGAKTQTHTNRENSARQPTPQESAESFQSRMTQRAPQTARNEAQSKTERSALSEEEADAITDTQVTRQPHQFVQMHNLRHRMQAGETQERFDGMMAKASRELNPSAVEAEPESPEEPTLENQLVLGEEETQESGKQADTPNDKSKPETKPQEEVKSTAQTIVQKLVKPVVTEQKPQQEISKADETLLGMTQQKQPEPVHEVIRSEVVQQPQQSQPTDPTEQIRTMVVRNLETQRTEFQMQLNPEELGKINVKMVLEAGKLTVEITALNPKSAEMLAKQADALAMSLKGSGIETTTVSVVTASENASSHMNGEFDLNNFQHQFGNGKHTNGQQESAGAKASGEQIGEGGQNDPEEAKAPKQMLNYEV